MAALTVVPTPTLRSLETYLAELEDTAALVPADQEAGFFAELGAAVIAAEDKRDALHNFMRRLESQQASDALEVKRLQARQSSAGKLLERLEHYVAGIIHDLGKTDDGKWKKLAGRFVTFSIRPCPASVSLADESLVPAAYKSVTLTLPLAEWEGLLDSLDVDTGAHLLSVVRQNGIACSKTALKAALETGPVEGARLVTDKMSLVRK